MIQFEFEKRLGTSRRVRSTVILFSIVASIILFGLFLIVVGANPIKAYSKILQYGFANSKQLAHTVSKMIPLLLTALAFSVPYKAGIWNVGAEGQLYMGAFLGGGVALFMSNLPTALIFPMIILAGFVAGAVWGAIAGFLKSLLRVDEIVSTLMMNYIAILWMNFLITGSWRERGGYGYPQSSQFPENTWLPTFGNTNIHITIIVGVILALIVSFLILRSRLGYEIKVVGSNRKTAELAGISSIKTIILVMILAGGFAGIAGAGEVAGAQHRLRQGLSPGYGFTGIVVSFLANNNPILIIPVAFLFAGMIVGGNTLQITMKLPSGIIEVFQGLTLFCMAAGHFFLEYKLKGKKK